MVTGMAMFFLPVLAWLLRFLKHCKTIQEELQVPYRLKKYDRGPDKLAPPELLAISPLGKSPVITDDNMTLSESGAIVGEHHT